jgi:hypothetical protein
MEAQVPTGERLTAPAAERNRDAILDQLKNILPSSTGRVLEIASGTGQHVSHFASALPHLSFTPTDISDDAFGSIVSWCEGLTNVAPARILDCSSHSNWSSLEGPFDAVLVANMCHIAPLAATEGLMEGSGQILSSSGVLAVYGPFTVAGEHSTQSNADFDASLRARNTEWGYRDVGLLKDLGARAGLQLVQTLEMPANNLMLVFKHE